jgi:DNA-binding transcriptional LysR family regulator
MSRFPANGTHRRSILKVGSTEAIKQIVAGGLGIAIVSAAAAADQIALGKLGILKPRNFTCAGA